MYFDLIDSDANLYSGVRAPREASTQLAPGYKLFNLKQPLLFEDGFCFSEQNTRGAACQVALNLFTARTARPWLALRRSFA